jgi:hypothetical protein
MEEDANQQFSAMNLKDLEVFQGVWTSQDLAFAAPLRSGL